MRPRLPFFFAAALLLLAASDVQAATYRFADLAWRSHRSDVHRTMLRLGFHLVRQATFGDPVYEGTLEGAPARVTLKFGPLGRLLAVDARTIPEEPDLLAAYERVKAVLAQRYGGPVYSQYLFRPPYREGDGRALDALKSNHAVFDTVWFDEHELNIAARSGVQLEVASVPFSRLEIRQFYLSDGWTDEYQRRQGASPHSFNVSAASGTGEVFHALPGTRATGRPAAAD